MTPKNKCSVSIETSLHCKATAELSDSIIDDMLKTDGSLKDLLHDDNDQQPDDKGADCNRGTGE